MSSTSVDLLTSRLGQTTGKLILADGTEYVGYSFGAERSTNGEVVFNTGMVGYPESLTDPSYTGQILVCTYPSIGNYGVPPEDKVDEHGLRSHFESNKIHIQAMIVADYCHAPSHYQNSKSLSAWLSENNVPALYGIDTRALTKKLREAGAMLGKIVIGEDQEVKFNDPNLLNLAEQVAIPEVRTLGNGKYKVLVVDGGIKNNILRQLLKLDVTLKVVPITYDFSEEKYDGLFLSNGPGDPTQNVNAIRCLKIRLAEKNPKPIFGICLGSQLLGLAAGAKTYKMKYGNRGMNQPCIDLRSGKCYVTPQNHGFAVDNDSLPEGWRCLFINANDNSNEGIIHTSLPFFSAQFHPEASGGPDDTTFLFDMFFNYVSQQPVLEMMNIPRPMKSYRKVLLLGSGGLSIGQAGEFDYSGSQAIKALKEEGIYVVLVNPNIATVQTSEGMADQVYFTPVTPEFVEKVIEKEHPDAILLQFGGQTALNCGMLLEKSGVLAKHGITVLGTQVSVIESTEDRQIFANKLAEIGETCAPSLVVDNEQQAVEFAAEVGYPVLIRAGFALGGLGSGFAADEAELRELVKKCFTASPQVIVDKSLRGWKEVEYEVVRDWNDNCVTVCNMENFDPLGIHTGDSIVVAPSQTLSNDEYFMLRRVAIKVVRHLGVVGECNIQYALDPHSNKYCVIEVNARLSRSSALASKATGYPLAYVAAKLALNKTLAELANSVTRVTTACFEPSLDYMVIKVPKWDLKKFTRVSSQIGSAMKSVGEVMSIGRSFEEALSKAIRMTDSSLDGFGDLGEWAKMTDEEMLEELSNPTDRRPFALAAALKRGWTVQQIYDITKIDQWFLSKLYNIIAYENSLTKLSSVNDLNKAGLILLKQSGLSDAQIARNLPGSLTELDMRRYRQSLDVHPWVKQIDTLAAEYPAFTNYLYTSYHGDEHDVVFESKEGGTMVLGCGAYRIGSSCEFDWCAVSCLRELRALGRKSIMINYNPETVSTDYDESDRLYFDELSLERVMDIYELENSEGVVVSVGGQIPNTLCQPLANLGVKILGTTAQSIDRAEDRSKFSAMLDQLGIDQPAWAELTSGEEALDFATVVGYPVLVRPSYVLSGAAMNVAADREALISYLDVAAVMSAEHPVVISKFILNAKEIEFDGVANQGKLVNYGISEHVENAGVHSGDATLMLPAQKLYQETVARVKRVAAAIAWNLQITGPFNIQFLSKNNELKVIECNLRSSRSFPFVSKTLGVNLVSLATQAMCGAPVKASDIHRSEFDYVCVKAPMFSFTRMQGADPRTRVEMTSTGEVAAFASSATRAFLSALLSTTFKIPPRNGSILLSVGSLSHKMELLDSVESLSKLGYKLFGTPGTVAFYKTRNIEVTSLNAADSKSEGASVLDYLRSGKIDLVVNAPQPGDKKGMSNGYQLRRAAVDFNVGLVSNVKCAIQLVNGMALMATPGYEHEVKSWSEYQTENKHDRRNLQNSPVISHAQTTKKKVRNNSSSDLTQSWRNSPKLQAKAGNTSQIPSSDLDAEQ